MVAQISTKTLYEQDFNLWLEETVNLLKTRQLDRVDYENLIEEIEDMGKSEKNSLSSNLRVLLIHLLKWKYQPYKRSNSWQYSIAEHSLRLNKTFKNSPSLRRYFDQILEECYQDARFLTMKETGLDIKTFPINLPFTKEQILNPDYLPED